MFVLGAGRTGSSLLTRMLALAGADLPHPLLPANPGNPTGHWEPMEALRINDAFLSGRASNWHDPSLRVQEAGLDCDDAMALRGDIRAFFQRHESALLAVKDPRIAAVAPLWFAAAEAQGFSVAIVLPLRHPAAAIASLRRRDGMGEELAAALWLKYTLLSERFSRSRPRVVVAYENLLADWRTEMARIAQALHPALRVHDAAAADRFLDPALCHHAQAASPRAALGLEWLDTTYAALSAAARDEDWPASDLDRVFGAYALCERGFRKVFTDFEQHWAIEAKTNGSR